MKPCAETKFFIGHYGGGYFTRQAMVNDLREMEQGTRWFPFGDEWQRPYRMAALRFLLGQPGAQLTLFPTTPKRAARRTTPK